MKLQCPNVVAAAIKLEELKKAAEGKNLWLLGNALIKDCGYGNTQAPRIHGAKPGVKNGSKATLERACDELKVHGINYTARTLADIRDVAIAFPKDVDRKDNVSFWGHAYAGSPQILNWILSTPSLRTYKNRKGFEMVDALLIRDLAKTYRQVQEQERVEDHRNAKDKLKDAKESGDLPAIRKAQDEVDETSRPPKAKGGGRPPSPSKLQAAAELMKTNAQWLETERDLEEAKKALDVVYLRLQDMNEINSDYAEGYIEDCTAIAALATRIVNFLKGKSNNLVHLRGDKNA